MNMENLKKAIDYIDEDVTFKPSELKEIEAWMDEWLKPGNGNSVTDTVYRKVRRLKLRDESRVNMHCMDGKVNGRKER